MIDSFASWTGEPIICAMDKNAYGFRDASATWSNVNDRELIAFGFMQSSIFRKVFFKFLGDVGILITGLQTDDGLCCHTNNAEGFQLKNYLMIFL